MEKLIEVFNLGGLPTAPLDSFLELQEDFKKSDPDKLSKLQMLIITRGFKYAFKAWKDPDGKLWIIDAHQRRKALLALRKSGFIIPEIPYEPIFAADKKEAVEEIAAYNSEFATKNPDTLLFKKYNIDTDTMERFNLGYEVKAVDYSIATPLFTHEHESEGIQEDNIEFSIPLTFFKDSIVFLVCSYLLYTNKHIGAPIKKPPLFFLIYYCNFLLFLNNNFLTASSLHFQKIFHYSLL